MAQADYYQLLGVDSTATADEIRRSYRRLARLVHPDTNPEWEDDTDANRRMAALNEAYAVLRDPSRRAEYDLQRQHRLDEMARRARAYEYTQRGYTHARARPRSQGQQTAWAQLVFRPSLDRLMTWAFVAIVLVLVGVFGISMAVQGTVMVGTATMLAGFMGGALAGMAAIPYFQGYVVLTRQALVEYPAFGLFQPRIYRYDEICDVHLQVRRHRYGTTMRVMIDYYQRDPRGQLNVHYYHSKWLMPVDDQRTLFYVLRQQARARKYAFSKPTWWAVAVGARELIGFLMATFGMMVAMLFCGCV